MGGQNTGAVTLAGDAGGVVRIAGDRRGQNRRSTLLTFFGDKATQPHILAGRADWPWARNASDPGGAHYADLAVEL